ncbi:MAG: KpsF/GutQ family sugar-phosphate isomerase [Phycisphaerales bacterium]|nr:KpsF/GutQ family sugar-phosphate isomerase [Phycisphaerales bacterium]
MRRDDQPAVDAAEERQFVEQALRVEAEAILRITDCLGSSLHAAVELLAACDGHVVATGMGKSGLIAQKISATLASLGQPSHFLHPSEAVHGDLGRVMRGDLVLALSYSGSTEEVLTLASLLKPDRIPIIGMSRSDDSPLAHAADVHVCVGDVSEACPLALAPTSSTTAMLAMGDALALAMSRRRNFDVDDFHKLHPGGALGAGLRTITEVLRFRVGASDRTIPVVREDRPLGDALQEAEAPRRPGAMLVVDDAGKLAGIFTDGDLRRLIIGGDVAAMRRPMSDVMTRDPQRLLHTALVRDAVKLVRDRRQDEIPVVDGDDRPIGLLDVQDLIALKVIQE